METTQSKRRPIEPETDPTGRRTVIFAPREGRMFPGWGVRI